MGDVKHWRYFLQFETGDYAAIFIDSQGFFSAVSSWGNYGHLWSSHGHRDVREFIADLEKDLHYAANKLSYRWPDQYDDEATLRNVKERILRMRRDGRLTEREARNEWDRLEDFENLEHHEDFARWFDVQDLGYEVHECVAMVTPREIVAFCARVFPKLAVVLRAQLEGEGYFAAGVAAQGGA